MYIEKLQINTFGKLSNLKLEFAPGVNIIEGANESGKSTLAAFIKFMFYGIPPKDRTALISWDNSGAAGTLTLNTGTHRYRIERALICTGNDTKQTWRETVQLIDLANNLPCHKGESPGELFFGVDADMFAATAFVSQIGGASTGGAKVAEGIENLLFSADETVNTQRALSKLDSARALLLHKNEKGGRLYELETECAELETKLTKALETSRDILTKEARLSDIKQNEANAKEKSDVLTKKIRQFEARTLVKLYDRMHALESKANELQAQLKTANVPNTEQLKRIQDTITRIADLKQQLAEADSRNAAPEQQRSPQLEAYLDRGGSEGISSEINASRTAARAQTAVAVVMSIFAIAALIFGLAPMIIGSKLLTIPIVVGGVLLAIAVTLFVIAAKSRSKASELDNEFDIDTLESELAEQKTAAEAAKLAALAVTDIRQRLDEALDNASREFETDARTDGALEARLAELTEQSHSTDGIKAEYEKYSALYAGMREQLSGYDEAEQRAQIDMSLDISDVDAANLTAIRREATFAAKSAASLSQHAAELERTLAGLYPTANNPTELSDRLNAAKRERTELERKHAAYKLAYDKLSEASTHLRESVAPRLAADAAELMGAVTDGKYTELGIGSELEMSAGSEGSSAHSVTLLSAGTQDAAYISLRLALTRMLYRKCTPMMIYDESFARLDDERLTRMLRLIASQEQSLVLTSNRRDGELMSTIGEYNKIVM
ncbi:MAG: AAA family ATPase [Clostridiales bacterium]|nr:AAA family ATPase [Clostridiales bacterium]